MKLCLDEHYSPQIAVDLREAGHDVVSVKERPELESLGDAELLAVMIAERRALLTENVADFAPLIRQMAAVGESHHGIVYSSSRSMPRSRSTIGMFVDALAELVRRFPGDDDFVDRIAWLNPPTRPNTP